MVDPSVLYWAEMWDTRPAEINKLKERIFARNGRSSTDGYCISNDYVRIRMWKERKMANRKDSRVLM